MTKEYTTLHSSTANTIGNTPASGASKSVSRGRSSVVGVKNHVNEMSGISSVTKAILPGKEGFKNALQEMDEAYRVGRETFGDMYDPISNSHLNHVDDSGLGYYPGYDDDLSSLNTEDQRLVDEFNSVPPNSHVVRSFFQPEGENVAREVTPPERAPEDRPDRAYRGTDLENKGKGKKEKNTARLDIDRAKTILNSVRAYVRNNAERKVATGATEEQLPSSAEQAFREGAGADQAQDSPENRTPVKHKTRHGHGHKEKTTGAKKVDTRGMRQGVLPPIQVNRDAPNLEKSLEAKKSKRRPKKPLRKHKAPKTLDRVEFGVASVGVSKHSPLPAIRTIAGVAERGSPISGDEERGRLDRVKTAIGVQRPPLDRVKTAIGVQSLPIDREKTSAGLAGVSRFTGGVVHLPEPGMMNVRMSDLSDLHRPRLTPEQECGLSPKPPVSVSQDVNLMSSKARRTAVAVMNNSVGGGSMGV